MFIWSILLFVGYTAGTLIQGSLGSGAESSVEFSPNTLVVVDGKYTSFIKPNGDFQIDVPDGTHVLEVRSLEYYFIPVRVDIKNNKISCFELTPGSNFDSFGKTLGYPLELYPSGYLEYFTQRQAFSIWSLFSNPMLLMSLLSVGMLFLIPKMKDAIVDPEIKKEMEQKAKMRQEQPQMPELPDVASKLADWFVPSDRKNK